MKRRGLLKLVGGALLAAGLSRSSAAQAQKGAGRIRPAISSTNLQWLRTGPELAHAAVEMGYGGVALTFGDGPAHVTEARKLDSFLGPMRKAGLVVDTIELNQPPAGRQFDELLQACNATGISQFIFGPFPYIPEQSIADQRSAFKSRLSALCNHAARSQVRALYRNHSGQFLGSLLLDIGTLIEDLDPRWIGICYDTGQGALSGGNGSWVVALRSAAKFIGCVLCTDNTLRFQLDTDEGGAFTGTPGDLEAGFGQRKTPHPFGGGGGQANPWIAPNVPLGTGLVDLPRLGAVLKEIGFQGPLIVQSDYPNGGAENGGDKLTLPSAMVLGAMKRDRLTLAAGLGSGLI